MREAGEDTAESAAKIAKWQGVQRDFLKQTGLKRQSEREMVYIGVSKKAKKAEIYTKPVKDAILKEKWSTIQDTKQVAKNYLQEKLDYSWKGEKCFIPKGAKFEKVKTIAGSGSPADICCLNRLVRDYGGRGEDWQKRAGRVNSAKYIFDVHWYEKDGVQYEVKLKNRKEQKKI